MNRILKLRDGSTLNVLGLVALGVLAGAIALAAVLIVPLVSLYRHPPKPATTHPGAEDGLVAFRKSTDYQVEQFKGRSWFFPPDAPVVTRHEKPKEYPGPAPVAYVNGTAWFLDGTKATIGQPASGKIKLVRGNAPWSVFLEYDGQSYEVPLFKKTDMAALRKEAMQPTKFNPNAPSALPVRTMLPAGLPGPGAPQPTGSGPQPTATAQPAAPVAGGPQLDPSGQPAPPPPASPPSEPGAAPGGSPPPAPLPPPAAPGAGPSPTPAPGGANPPSPGTPPADPPREPSAEPKPSLSPRQGQP